MQKKTKNLFISEVKNSRKYIHVEDAAKARLYFKKKYRNKIIVLTIKNPII